MHHIHILYKVQKNHQTNCMCVEYRGRVSRIYVSHAIKWWLRCVGLYTMRANNVFRSAEPQMKSMERRRAVKIRATTTTRGRECEGATNHAVRNKSLASFRGRVVFVVMQTQYNNYNGNNARDVSVRTMCPISCCGFGSRSGEWEWPEPPREEVWCGQNWLGHANRVWAPRGRFL